MHKYLAAKFGPKPGQFADYGWVITRDRYAEREPDEQSEAGTVGPRNIRPEIEAALRAGHGEPFRLTAEPSEPDEDPVVYEGRYVDLTTIGYADDVDGELPFGPLTDFGSPNYGCTDIEYEEDGVWKVL